MRILSVLALALIGSCALATTYPMTLHKIEDDQGIHGVAYRYLAPKGWKAEAKLGWTDNIMQPTVLIASADSPDGKFGYSFLPGIDFMFGGVTPSHQFFGNMPGSQTGTPPPNKGTDFLLKVVQNNNLQNVKIEQREDHPLDVSHLLGRKFGQNSALLYSFTKNGQEMEGMMFARFDGAVFGNPGGQAQAYNGDWEMTNSYSVYYPKGEGKKAMRFFSLAVPSYTPTPAFVKARGTWILVLNHQIQENIRQAGEISKITARLSRDREDAIMGAYHTQQAAENKAVSGFCDYIGDIDRYHDQDGEVQLASGYKDAWSDGKGNYILSDNIGYDPNQGSSGSWSRLDKVR